MIVIILQSLWMAVRYRGTGVSGAAAVAAEQCNNRLVRFIVMVPTAAATFHDTCLRSGSYPDAVMYPPRVINIRRTLAKRSVRRCWLCARQTFRAR
jgi:hypothetical protein